MDRVDAREVFDLELFERSEHSTRLPKTLQE